MFTYEQLPKCDGYHSILLWSMLVHSSTNAETKDENGNTMTMTGYSEYDKNVPFAGPNVNPRAIRSNFYLQKTVAPDGNERPSFIESIIEGTFSFDNQPMELMLYELADSSRGKSIYNLHGMNNYVGPTNLSSTYVKAASMVNLANLLCNKQIEGPEDKKKPEEILGLLLETLKNEYNLSTLGGWKKLLDKVCPEEDSNTGQSFYFMYNRIRDTLHNKTKIRMIPVAGQHRIGSIVALCCSFEQLENGYFIIPSLEVRLNGTDPQIGNKQLQFMAKAPPCTFYLPKYDSVNYLDPTANERKELLKSQMEGESIQVRVSFFENTHEIVEEARKSKNDNRLKAVLKLNEDMELWNINYFEKCREMLSTMTKNFIVERAKGWNETDEKLLWENLIGAFFVPKQNENDKKKPVFDFPLITQAMADKKAKSKSPDKKYSKALVTVTDELKEKFMSEDVTTMKEKLKDIAEIKNIPVDATFCLPSSRETSQNTPGKLFLKGKSSEVTFGHIRPLVWFLARASLDIGTETALTHLFKNKGLGIVQNKLLRDSNDHSFCIINSKLEVKSKVSNVQMNNDVLTFFTTLKGYAYAHRHIMLSVLADFQGLIQMYVANTISDDWVGQSNFNTKYTGATALKHWSNNGELSEINNCTEPLSQMITNIGFGSYVKLLQSFGVNPFVHKKMKEKWPVLFDESQFNKLSAYFLSKAKMSDLFLDGEKKEILTCVQAQKFVPMALQKLTEDVSESKNSNLIDAFFYFWKSFAALLIADAHGHVKKLKKEEKSRKDIDMSVVLKSLLLFPPMKKVEDKYVGVFDDFENIEGIMVEHIFEFTSICPLDVERLFVIFHVGDEDLALNLILRKYSKVAEQPPDKLKNLEESKRQELKKAIKNHPLWSSENFFKYEQEVRDRSSEEPTVDQETDEDTEEVTKEKNQITTERLMKELTAKKDGDTLIEKTSKMVSKLTISNEEFNDLVPILLKICKDGELNSNGMVVHESVEGWEEAKIRSELFNAETVGGVMVEKAVESICTNILIALVYRHYIDKTMKPKKIGQFTSTVMGSNKRINEDSGDYTRLDSFLTQFQFLVLHGEKTKYAPSFNDDALFSDCYFIHAENLNKLMEDIRMTTIDEMADEKSRFIKRLRLMCFEVCAIGSLLIKSKMAFNNDSPNYQRGKKRVNESEESDKNDQSKKPKPN